MTVKNIIILSYLFASFITTHGQRPTWKETTQQKKTQRKYSAQQLAALKACLEVIKKGYVIVQQGLAEIGDSKQASFLRDQQYFNSLREVSAVVKSSPRISEIYRCQQQIRSDFSRLYNDCRSDKNFSSSEVRYIGKVYANMIDECESALDELLLVATGATELSDAQRLQRLDLIAGDLNDQLAFTRHFIAGTRSLSMERAKEKSQNAALRKLYGKQ